MNKIRHCVLADSLTWPGVNLVLDKLFKKTPCVRYFTDVFWGSFGNVPVTKNRHFVLDVLLVLLRDHYIMNQWIKLDTMC